MERTQLVINEHGHPKKIGQGEETIVGDRRETTTIMVSLRKLRLVSQGRTIEETITATACIEKIIGMSQVPAGRRRSQS
jgi:hypothetical protein